MADVYPREVRSRVMRSITKKDTLPEIAVRRLLHGMGYRFRLHQKKLPGCPDIVLAKHRTVILVHGCFWHQHSCKLGRPPKSNLSYWIPKLERNRNRDAKASKELNKLGWYAIVVWECETYDPKKLERIIKQRLSLAKKRFKK
jgi:DNA mismatch endonuclease (patch repair protein)